jgi:predicted PurR-regulated permease PerM
MLWGIPGMILALPITASLKVLLITPKNLNLLDLGEADDKYFSNKAKIV